MAAPKRLHNGYEQDGDQPDDKRMRRLPSFSTYGSPRLLSFFLPFFFRASWLFNGHSVPELH
jgi:hypothetical protein